LKAADAGNGDTERLTAIAQQLVQRHGIRTRTAITREQIPGGFRCIYPVLKAMEESGKLRRGYFVEGLGGIQFAAPGADDAIRHRPKTEESQPLVISATDPANAYGAALAWPKTSQEGTRLQRVSGAQVILYEGRLLGYLARSRRSLTTFLDREHVEWEQDCDRLARAVAESARKGPPLMVAKIDNQPPELSCFMAALKTAGFIPTSRGLVLREKSRTHIRHSVKWPEESA